MNKFLKYFRYQNEFVDCLLCIFFRHFFYFMDSWNHHSRHKMLYALKMQAPPASLILFSAFCEKYFAFTMIGILGKCPWPRSL